MGSMDECYMGAMDDCIDFGSSLSVFIFILSECWSYLTDKRCFQWNATDCCRRGSHFLCSSSAIFVNQEDQRKSDHHQQSIRVVLGGRKSTFADGGQSGWICHVIYSCHAQWTHPAWLSPKDKISVRECPPYILPPERVSTIYTWESVDESCSFRKKIDFFRWRSTCASSSCDIHF